MVSREVCRKPSDSLILAEHFRHGNVLDSFLQSAQRQHGYIFDESRIPPESLRRLIKTVHVTSPYS
ncbi:MAG: hypothetical protein H0X47_08145 [Nitrospirales bacterium]|nr:hypothetical protein [Nitrospirales bacterium]